MYDIPNETKGMKRQLTGVNTMCALKSKKPKLVDSLIKKANKQMIKKRKCESKVENDSKKRKIDCNDDSAKSSWPQLISFLCYRRRVAEIVL